MPRTVVPFVLILSLLPALASDPGQPLDCSDWVFLEAGLSCEIWANCGTLPAGNWCGSATSKTMDNEGYMYRLTFGISPLPYDDCTGTQRARLELLRFDGTTESVVAYVDERCNLPPYGEDGIGFHSSVRFDEEQGRMIFRMTSECKGPGCTNGGGQVFYDSVHWGVAVHGFTTTFEILQSYTPTSGPISFRVPYMPEGFQGADWFDTYYGDLATVGDWSRAQALECGYPATTPASGDFMTVDDSLPNPPPGQGRYYVTAVSYQGERRYGRKAMGGVLSGRDPAVLPVCLEPSREVN